MTDKEFNRRWNVLMAGYIIFAFLLPMLLMLGFLLSLPDSRP